MKNVSRKQRRKQQTIRRVLYFVISACILLALYILIRNWFVKSNIPPHNSAPNITKSEESAKKGAHELNGTVTEKSTKKITVLSDKGEKYSFKNSAAILKVDSSSIIIGCPITVYYYGSLNKNLAIQNVQIEKTIVKTSKDEAARAHQILDSMSLDEKVGQMFIVRCPKKNAAQLASKYHLGGYILFSRDFKGKTKSQVSSNILSYQNTSKISMLIGVDEEGGIVNRISIYKKFRAVPFWSPQSLYTKGGWDLIISDTKEKAELLKSIGINLNMAPVCDVSMNKSNYIYPRSFGKNAVLTAQYVERVVNTMRSNQLGSVLKHFPGYGNNIDTHTGIAYDNRSYNSFVKNDFLPFISGINAGADAVLVSHNIVECMDSKNPASLSAKVHQILRTKLNFNGVIMTDDLSMDAIRKFTGEDKAAVMAVLAGNDMICCTDFEKQIPAVISAVNNGMISKKSIDESVIKILRWKLRLGIIK